MNAAEFIRRFAREARACRWRWSLLRLCIGQALVLVLVVLGVELLAPRYTLVAILLALVFLAAVVGIAIARERRHAARLLESDDAPPGSEGRLVDDLTTWVGLDRRRRADGPMADWLATDLAATLATIPEERRRRLGYRPLGRVRYLLPLLVLLFLLRAFQLPLPGLAGDGGSTLIIADAPIAGGGGSGAGGSGGAGNESETDAKPAPDPTVAEPGEEDEPPDPQLPPPPDPPPPEEEAPESGEQRDQPAPPNPLLDLPVEDQFVVPHFVGDGETRRALAQRAELEVPGPGGVSPRGAPGVADDRPKPDEPPDFEAAYERAMRARHVPPEERDMVRRYFEALRREAK